MRWACDGARKRSHRSKTGFPLSEMGSKADMNVARMQTRGPAPKWQYALLDAELWRWTARSPPKLHGIYTIRDIDD